ncbi:MAG: CHAT domain-containing protein [Ignavibacteriae bacterium]|nr:CHAT domain-containing protein [Ignavibacteriota bacterium]
MKRKLVVLYVTSMMFGIFGVNRRLVVLLTLWVLSLSQIYSQTTQEEFNVLFKRAQEYSAHYMFDSAITLGYLGYNTLTKMYGENDTSASKFLQQIGVYHLLAGKLDSAEILVKRAIAMREAAVGKSHRLLFVPLGNLANIYFQRGMYKEAGALFIRAKDICINVWGTKHANYGRIQKDIAEYYVQYGKYQEAERAFIEASTVMEQTLKPNQAWDLIQCLNNMATMYSNLNRDKEAEVAYTKALSPSFTSHQSNSLFIANTKIHLVRLALKRGETCRAESLLVEAQTFQQAAYEGDHPDLARSTLQLAEYYHTIKEEHKADSAYKKSLNMFSSSVGEQNPLTAKCLLSYSRFCRDMNRIDDAIAYSERTIKILEKLFERNADILSENDLFTYAATLKSAFDEYLTNVQMHLAIDSVTMNYSKIILSTKAISSEILLNRQQILSAQNKNELSELFSRYKAVRWQIAQSYVKGFSEQTVSQMTNKLDSLEKLSRNIESELIQHSPNLFTNRVATEFTTKRISSSLPKDAMLIEYVTYNDVSKGEEKALPRYLVMIMDEKGRAKITEVGNAVDVERVVEGYRLLQKKIQSMKDESAKHVEEYQKIGSQMYDLLWKPIAPHVKQNSTLFIAPDGALNLVSFAGLIDEDGKYFIEKHPIHYLSAGRDLLRLNKKEKSNQGLLAFGDPDYDAPAIARLSHEQQEYVSGHVPSDPYSYRNVRSECDILRNLDVVSLPATRREVSAVKEYWGKKYKREIPTVYYGADASEEHFKQNAAGHRVIHLATHGYFLNPDCRNDTTLHSPINQSLILKENPLLQSGLLLAGANLRGADADSLGAEDGILTALEVSAMDLRGTDLVVLSACETGLGEIKAGEGVYGLRRAFQLAGAKTVVSSLWQIPDNETVKFMKDLYAQTATTYPELMQKVMVRRLNELRSKNRSTHPYSWAGFVAAGEWFMTR